MKSFFHEKINFICSKQRVIFALLHRYECFENKEKEDEKQRKNKGMTSAVSSPVRIWKICHSYPGCRFVWKIRVVYFRLNTHIYVINTAMWLVIVLTIYQVIDSVCRIKTSNSIWRPFPAFQKKFRKSIFKNALIQKAIPEKTKIARKYGLKNLKGKKKKNLKYQFDSFTRRKVVGVSSALVV